MKRTVYIFLASLFFAASCSIDLEQEMQQINAPSDKIINTNFSSTSKTLLIKLTDTLTEPLFTKLKEVGVESVIPVFKSTKGKKRLEKACGLHLWYKITTCDGNEEDVALRLSFLEEVAAIQYNNIASKASDCVVYPYDGRIVALNAETKSANVFNDPYLADQWNFDNQGNVSIATTAYKGGDINIVDSWGTLTAGDPSIIVAVVDEGVAYSHPDLRANMWVNQKEYDGTEGVDDDGNGYVDDIYGYNFVSDGSITWSKENDSGHGTHCAGIISAVNNNGIGISSVAGGSGNNDGVKIMSCQIFDDDQGGEEETTARAIKYAADMGASIISCSFGTAGGTFLSDGEYERKRSIEADAIHYFESVKNNPVVDGGIAIFASGNDGDPYATYPGALGNVISVSAFGPDYLPTYYTNYGPGCNIVAPGGEAYLPPWTSYRALILSTVPTELYESGYGYMQGTSMACPHVSGIAALGLAYAKKIGKTFSLDDFKGILVTSANDFDKRLNGTKEYYKNTEPPLELYRYRKKMGTGSIDTWLFLMKIEGIPCLFAEAGNQQWLDLSEYFGTSSVNLTYLGVEISDRDKEAIGLVEDPYIKYGRLFVNPTKIGSARLTVTAVGGGTELGGENNIGGMKISQEISIIVRSFKSGNGGWL